MTSIFDIFGHLGISTFEHCAFERCFITITDVVKLVLQPINSLEWTMALQASVIPKAKYMTLGPKLFCCSKMTITRRGKRVRRSYRLESSPNCLNIPNSRSKQDFQKSEFSHKRPLREYLMTRFLYIYIYIYYC